MIIDTINNSKLYQGLNANIRKALDYLASTDFSKMEPGRYEVDGDTVFALVQKYDTKPRDKGAWEAHRRYIDVQYVASGVEAMGYAPIDSLSETQAYSAEKDFLLLAGSGDYVTAHAGMFVIFYPKDAHSPCLAHGNSVPVLKVVMKVRAD
jgi:YhcH/YjgK/YiaL family protein